MKPKCYLKPRESVFRNSRIYLSKHWYKIHYMLLWSSCISNCSFLWPQPQEQGSEPESKRVREPFPQLFSAHIWRQDHALGLLTHKSHWLKASKSLIIKSRTSPPNETSSARNRLYLIMLLPNLLDSLQTDANAHFWRQHLHSILNTKSSSWC